MNIIDIPYFVEFFFGISTVVFVVALYAILPALMFNKKTLFKPLFINSLWQKGYVNLVEGLEKLTGFHKKKNIKEVFVIVENNIESNRN